MGILRPKFGTERITVGANLYAYNRTSPLESPVSAKAVIMIVGKNKGWRSYLALDEACIPDYRFVHLNVLWKVVPDVDDVFWGQHPLVPESIVND